MARQCTCVRCKAEEFVRNVYPKMSDLRVLAVATDIARAMRASIENTRDLQAPVSTPSNPKGEQA